MKKLYGKLTLVMVLAAVLAFTGCGKSNIPTDVSVPDTNSDTTTTDNNVSDAPLVRDSSPATAVSVSVTYYSVTKTIAPMSGWPTKTYTATGRCLTYNSDQYCWDDGKKTVVISGFSYYYSYFNMNKTGATTFSHSNGGMVTDFMLAPTYLHPLGGLITNMAAGSVTEVMNTGTPTTVSCSVLEDGNLDCGSFQVDTHQASL